VKPRAVSGWRKAVWRRIRDDIVGAAEVVGA
jgi:hypothetical protein